jgi:DNA-binding SARP family transcriptional activator
VDFRLLGPLEVSDRGEPVGVGGGKQRAVLAILLLRANEVVSTERLIDDVWRGAPTLSAESTLHTYVSRLRKALGGGRIVTQLPGYMLGAEPDELDVARFERLARLGREALACGRTADAADLLGRAMSLWRGAPLAEFECEAFAQAEIARLEEQRLTTLEDRLEAELALGRHADVAPALEPLIARHPLRERLRAHFMLALYRGGRQADALAAYRDARALLVEELGIEPSPPLQQLHARILGQDPSLELPLRRTPLTDGVLHPHRVRKTVTVVAVDLRGKRASDPETLAAARTRAVDVIGTALRKHGAFVETRADGVIATFGVPALHDDDPVRAVRGAAAPGDELAGVTRANGLEFRIGIETGEVLAAGAQVLEGTAVAEARRLAETARAGDIVIGDGTKRAVGRIATTERAPGGWRIVGVRPTGDVVRRRFRSPLVGRTTELRQLRHAFAAAAERRSCHLFTVLGAAGIGKSRLARELCVSLGMRATTLTGRCLPYGEGITFWPLAEIVKQAAGDVTPRAIEPVLLGIPRAQAIAARIASALGVAGAEADGDETLWAFRSFLETLSRRRPLVVVFEDIHWAEPTLLDFIEHLAERSRDAPMLMLCLARPELLDDRRKWSGGKANATSLLLEGLSQRESAELIDRLSRDRALAESARTRIADAAGGNPLFIEQMLAHAGESAGDRLTIPPSIHALLAARIDGLPVDERRLLDRAAIVGREFTLAAATELSPPAERGDVARAVDELVRKEFVSPDHSDESTDGAFRFTHLLVRDTAYAAVPKASRAELHEAFANYVDRAFPERAGELDEIVGFHLEQAHAYRAELEPGDEGLGALAARAAERLARAAERAQARCDVSGGTNLFARAAALVDDDRQWRASLLTSLAAAMRESGDFDNAHSVLAEAQALAARSRNEALQARVALHEIHHRFSQDPTFSTADLMQEGRRIAGLARRARDERLMHVAGLFVAWGLALEGRESEGELRRVRQYAEAEGDEGLMANVMRMEFPVWVDDRTPAPVALTKLSRCRDALTDDRAIAANDRAAAELAAMLGRFDEARARLADDALILAELGLSVIAAGACEVRAGVELLAGDPHAAEHILRPAHERLQRMGDRIHSATIAARLAEVLCARGQYDEAVRLVDRTLAEPMRYVGGAVRLTVTHAKLAARLGNQEEARRSARYAISRAAQTVYPSIRGEALLGAAETYALLREPKRALLHARAAAREFETKHNLVLLRRALVSASAFA